MRGVILASGLLLLCFCWFAALLYIRIVFQLELGRGSIRGTPSARSARFFFFIGPPAGVIAAAWGLVELARAHRHVRRLQ